MEAAEIEPVYDATPADELEAELVDAFASFMTVFGRAQAGGVDGQAVLARELRAAMGDSFGELPPMVRMLLG